MQTMYCYGLELVNSDFLVPCMLNYMNEKFLEVTYMEVISFYTT